MAEMTRRYLRKRRLSRAPRFPSFLDWGMERRANNRDSKEALVGTAFLSADDIIYSTLPHQRIPHIHPTSTRNLFNLASVSLISTNATAPSAQ